VSARRTAALVAAAAALGAGSAAAAPAAGPTMGISAAVSPRVALFGDSVVATVELVFDRRVVRPESVVLDADFTPWKPAAMPARVRAGSGDLVRLTYRIPLTCLTIDCIPAEAGKPSQFQSGQVRYGVRSQPGRIVDTFAWPPFQVGSRLAETDVERGHWYADPGRVAAASYRIQPGSLGAFLLAAAAALALLGALLAVRAAPRRVPAAVEIAGEPPTALELALELARATAAANGGSPEARKALERLARELGAEGLAGQAVEARRLAWSPGQPSRAEVEALVGAVRGELGRRS